ncbi:putative protein phosphatase 2C 8 isoform X1 [Prunus yedoensis var. nudiflora]|uniref:PPM-type phosphatase domain-containing protein n=1 Tax=Prunus yedoensis var. nudiflora TaxID=2094558 RepID=A0A314ZA17_PRUYE|nr:putative protein phosphatase 2C 8 isoform X1 [Prunus yedoensis var. nudiflora]
MSETETSNSAPKNETPKEVEPAPKQKQKRESNSEDSISAAKKSKTEQEQGPEVDLGEGNKDSGVNEPNSGGREMGFKIEADAAEDKGLRHAMEDAWVVLLDASLDFPGKLRCAHFAIYDGHGGRLAAEYAQKHLHTNALSAGLPRELLDVKAAKKAILDGFRKTDESLLQESAAGGWQDGATAVCVWILGKTVFVANIGDAKAVVARSSPAEGLKNGSDEASHLKAIVLTREHKAIYAQERARIQKAGGNVSSNGRLQGRLEVSRAFGDRHFKKVGVVSTPDIHSFDLTEREHFIILGCDGLWGVIGPSDAVAFVQKLLKEGLPVSTISRRLVKEAVRERRCKDNCTDHCKPRIFLFGAVLCVSNFCICNAKLGSCNYFSNGFGSKTQPIQGRTPLTEEMSSSTDMQNWKWGCIYLLGHCLAWASWMVFQAPMLKKYPVKLTLTSFTCFFGLIQFLVITVFVQTEFENWKIQSGEELFTILYATLMPVMATLVLGDQLYSGGIIGALLIMLGLYSVLWGKNEENRVVNHGEVLKKPLLEADIKEDYGICIISS